AKTSGGRAGCGAGNGWSWDVSSTVGSATDGTSPRSPQRPGGTPPAKIARLSYSTICKWGHGGANNFPKRLRGGGRMAEPGGEKFAGEAPPAAGLLAQPYTALRRPAGGLP